MTEYYRKVRNADDNAWKYVKITDSSVINSLQSWDISSNNNDGIAVLANDPMANGATVPTDESAMFGIYTRSVSDTGYFIDLGKSFAEKTICADAPIYISLLEEDSITGKTFKVASTVTGEYTLNSKGYLPIDGKIYYVDDANVTHESNIVDNVSYIVLADFYTLGVEDKALELQINAEDFAGYFYVEADTLVRRQSNGSDLPAIITIPKAKIQSNFSIAMASSGDPSTFTFTMDAMPDYTYFNRKKKVLCAFQIIDENISSTNRDAVMRDGTSYDHKGFNV